MQFYLGQQAFSYLYYQTFHIFTFKSFIFGCSAWIFFSRNTWHVTVLFSYTMIRRQRLKLWCRKTQSRVWARSYVNINMSIKFNKLTSNWSVNLFLMQKRKGCIDPFCIKTTSGILERLCLMRWFIIICFLKQYWLCL